jgi:CheY-like chemotaxis protein
MSKPLLLIVDNHDHELTRWSSVGERLGSYALLRAQSFEDALDALNNHVIDVLVTDLFLTEESERSLDPSRAEGLGLIERCRALYPWSRIVAITGILEVATDAGAIALEAGADDFISSGWKKINADALLEHKLGIYLKLLRVVHP